MVGPQPNEPVTAHERNDIRSANDFEPGQGASAELMFLVRIPMRDGLHLAANIFLPRQRTAPVPALVELTPYSRDTATADGNRFAHAGFAYVVADCRGRGDSEGVFYGHEGEISDSRDLIDWIAAQPWCDGQVSGFGGSYTGHNQWSMAVSGSPHLCSIAPGVASNPGAAPSGGGIPTDHQFGWGWITAGKTLSQQFAANASAMIAMLVDAFDRRESFRDLNRRMGGPWALPDTQNTAPQMVPFGERIDPHESLLSAVTVPSLEITSPYDLACRGALDHHRRIHAHGTPEALAGNYLVLGPWDHGGAFGGVPSVGELTFAPAAAVDMTELMIEWWRWAMCDGPFPAFLRDHVVYYVTGAEEWRWAPDLGSITDHTVDWYLQGHDGPHSGGTPVGSPRPRRTARRSPSCATPTTARRSNWNGSRGPLHSRRTRSSYFLRTTSISPTTSPAATRPLVRSSPRSTGSAPSTPARCSAKRSSSPGARSSTCGSPSTSPTSTSPRCSTSCGPMAPASCCRPPSNVCAIATRRRACSSSNRECRRQ
jgi:hypothetical protein